MIYLDNAATTNIIDAAKDELNVYLGDQFYNPSALYGVAAQVRKKLESSRELVAEKLGVSREEIVFTSCATESNNWVLNSGRKYKKGNIVTTLGEHPSVFETATMLSGKGVDVRFAKLNSLGEVDEKDLFEKIDGETALVSLIHCSNETGVVNDLENLIPKIRLAAPKALIHCDGVQAFCKISTNLRQLDVDLYSLSAHKIGGAKGVGALFINKKLNIAPFLLGGGQERGLRSGTENVAGIMCFAKAAEISSQNILKNHINEIYHYTLAQLRTMTNVIINGEARLHSHHIISASILGIRAEVLQHMLSDEQILIGLGSACSSKSRQNRVLSAIGRSSKEIEGSIRLSFSNQNTMDEIVHAINRLKINIELLREKIGS